jgi:DNA-binding MarR family transcriptional regulator
MNENTTKTVDKIIENLIYIHPLLSKGLTRTIRAKTNLNPGSLYVLGLLSRYPVLSMSEIGCKLGMPKPHVTAHIDKLVAENLAERISDPNDRRIVNIKLSQKGKEDFDTIIKELSSEMRLRINKLDENKLVQLFDSSNKVREILVEITF